ncbi:SagB/ThcOx family dehydrogenase [Paraburkholderia denitrificans]|uniref:SagB/ThcOx family dehydrogenase n=1 Tax=Paraburkholderia denitrificans TaxID=694025 RepID=A0ABW0JDZ7_9BURK
MKRREVLAVLAASAMTEVAGCEAQESPARYVKDIALPKPNVTGSVSFEEAITRRRSVRTFGAAQLPIETIGQLLWAGQGITSQDGKRAAPSAGALYALELYAVTPTEVIHYLPHGHRAETRATPDLRPELRELALGQASVGGAPLVIAVAADPSRLAPRYGARANRYTDLEVGHAAQNMLLQAAVLGLVAVPVGSFDAARAARTLALPPGQTPGYLIPVGFPA